MYFSHTEKFRQGKLGIVPGMLSSLCHFAVHSAPPTKPNQQQNEEKNNLKKEEQEEDGVWN